MDRRRFLLTSLAGALVGTLVARAQPAKLPTIGFLGPNTPSLDSHRVGAFVQRLRELGRIEGRNVAIEYRWGKGRVERLAELAAELVRLKVDVIVTGGTRQVVAAKEATSAIPIVFAAVGDPVGTGLVASLARPGGNVTGLSLQATDLAAKRTGLLREVVPGLRRLAVMANSDTRAAVAEMREVQVTARTLGLEIVTSEIRRPEDIAPAFEALKNRAEALYVCNDPLVTTHRITINTLALGGRLPAMYSALPARAGGPGDRVRRRAFVYGSLLTLAAPLVGEAQQTAPIPRLCYLAYEPSRPHDGAFLQSLRELGYAEGRNLTIDSLSADGRFERLPALAAECVRLKPNVIVALTTPGALAAKQATSTIPIVSGPTGDPVGTGIVASLARPGGNVTGLTQMSPGLTAKRLELLKQAVPGISRVSVLVNLSDPIATPQVREMEALARSLGVQLRVRDVRNPEHLPGAFAAAANERDEGLLTTIETIFLVHRVRVLELAAKHNLPAMYPYREVTDAGGMMSYGPNRLALYRRMAVYVDKILKGAKPADLPVEQPTEFEFVINLKTAKALGLTIPPSLLARADQVIE